MLTQRSHIFAMAVNTFILFAIPEGQGSRNDIHKMMYQNFEHPTSCFRRLNGTHQFGCSTPSSGRFGAIYLVSNQSDLNWLVNNAQAGPYMAVLGPNMFNSAVMDSLVSSSIVSGVLLVISEGDIPPNYSPDDVCPNKYSGDMSCVKENPWNPYGNFFLVRDWPIPIFTLNNPAMIKTILDCHNKFNLPVDDSQSSRPLCSLHMKAHMFASVDSATCMRRSTRVNFNPMKFCDPLADQNIYLSMGNLEWEKGNVIIVAARLDSVSMFDGISPGAMSSVTGFVTLMTTAHILHKLEKPYNSSKSVIFLLLNGEGFDYIGSSRVVYDIGRENFPGSDFPLKFEHLKLLIDISQLDSNSDLYLHYHENLVAENFSKELRDTGIEYGLKFKFVPTKNLPPSSLHSFYKAEKINELPGIVLTNYKERFTNRYYHGLFDTSENLQYKYANGSSIANKSIQFYLASVADTLSRTLYKHLTDEEMPSHELETSLVDELLFCYLESSSCKLIQTLVGGELEVSKTPFPLYIGVGTSLNQVTRSTGLLLASLSSPRTNLSEGDCTTMFEPSKIYSLAWIYGESGTGECINTTLKFTTASSPAFEIENYNWTSQEFSTWTESVWEEISLRMFLRPSRSQEIIILGTGLTTMVLSFVLIYWFSTHGKHFFIVQGPVNC